METFSVSGCLGPSPDEASDGRASEMANFSGGLLSLNMVGIVGLLGQAIVTLGDFFGGGSCNTFFGGYCHLSTP